MVHWRRWRGGKKNGMWRDVDKNEQMYLQSLCMHVLYGTSKRVNRCSFENHSKGNLWIWKQCLNYENGAVTTALIEGSCHEAREARGWVPVILEIHLVARSSQTSQAIKHQWMDERCSRIQLYVSLPGNVLTPRWVSICDIYKNPLWIDAPSSEGVLFN